MTAEGATCKAVAEWCFESFEQQAGTPLIQQTGGTVQRRYVSIPQKSLSGGQNHIAGFAVGTGSCSLTNCNENDSTNFQIDPRWSALAAGDVPAQRSLIEGV